MGTINMIKKNLVTIRIDSSKIEGIVSSHSKLRNNRSQSMRIMEDSGSTHRITNDMSLLHDVVRLNGQVMTLAAKDESMVIEVTAKRSLKLYDKDGMYIRYMFRDVLFVPQAHSSLIGKAAIIAQGFS